MRFADPRRKLIPRTSPPDGSPRDTLLCPFRSIARIAAACSEREFWLRSPGVIATEIQVSEDEAVILAVRR